MVIFLTSQQILQKLCFFRVIISDVGYQVSIVSVFKENIPSGMVVGLVKNIF